MKNKFKKSKIIVPALALITATTVASVTGTVAWFTATRSVTITGNKFVATKLESKLNVTLTEGVGTTVDSSNGTVSMGANDKLTHGSYNAKIISPTEQGNLYVAKVSDDGESVESFIDLGTEATAKTQTASSSSNNWIARADTTKGNVYYGVSWTMTFSLESATTNQTDYLLFDVAGSSFTNKATTTTDPTTMPGFRIAFMTDKTFLVIGGDSTKTHVKGTTSDSTESFEDKRYEVITANTEKASDITTSSTSDSLSESKFCLGEVGTSAAKKELAVKCVAWYEGTDANVADTVSSKTVNMSEVEATLSFYTRYKVVDGTGN